MGRVRHQPWDVVMLGMSGPLVQMRPAWASQGLKVSMLNVELY